MNAMYDKVTLIGLGLIASSMGHAMKKAGLANTIVGYSQTKKTRDISLDIGFVDSVAETIEDAVADSDLIVLSVPVGAMSEVAKKIGSKLKPGATITDVGSVKKSVIDMVNPHYHWVYILFRATLWLVLSSPVQNQDFQIYSKTVGAY